MCWAVEYLFVFFFFFFKQKTAYEIMPSLVGSEMCIRDSLNTTSLNVVKPGDHISFGAFDVELIHVNHSIPDAVALAIRCKAGTIIQTGDFKIDTTPIDGEMIDLARFAEIGLSLIHISEPTRLGMISYAVFCLKKKK